MPKSAANLIDLSTIIKGLGELGTIKKHLFKASKEILLAVQSLFSLADGYVNGMNVEQAQSMATVLGYVQKTIQGLVNRLSQVDEDDFLELQEKVFQTILAVIDHEIKENNAIKTQKARMKQEVLLAIRGVLLKEMHNKARQESYEQYG